MFFCVLTSLVCAGLSVCTCPHEYILPSVCVHVSGDTCVCGSLVQSGKLTARQSSGLGCHLFVGGEQGASLLPGVVESAPLENMGIRSSLRGS